MAQEMNVEQAIRTRRSIRKFQNRDVSMQIVDELLELARYYPSAANLQPLKFIPITTDDMRMRISSQVKWAGYLKNYAPKNEELPAAYIIVCGDLQISRQFEFAAGAAVSQLLLAIHAKGLSGCCLGIPERLPMCRILELSPEQHEPLYAIALGYPAHSASVVEQRESCAYYLDEDGNFIVPKRPISEIVLSKEK